MPLMIKDNSLRDYAIRLAQARTAQGHTFECRHIPGDTDVLQVDILGTRSFPVFMTQTETQILCIVYLWTESDVKTGMREAMLDMMLETSIAIPLSAYARTGDNYVLFGALSKSSSLDKIIEEIVTLNNNTFDVVTAMEDYIY